ncbi:MAG: hypothetical protein ACYS6K_26715 [Planctomycetota bacterium]|jgi:hypothetical protein
MKALKPVLLIVVLLSLLMVVGCHEGYTSHNYSADNFAWEQSATGFWQPNVGHTYSSNIELRRK